MLFFQKLLKMTNFWLCIFIFKTKQNNKNIYMCKYMIKYHLSNIEANFKMKIEISTY